MNFKKKLISFHFLFFIFILFFLVYLSLQIGSSTNPFVISQIRMPRVLSSGLVGSNLALAGLLTQCLMRNPIADPKLLGISPGGALVVSIISFFSITIPNNFLPILIFIGCFISGAVVYFLSFTRRIDNTALILTGAAISSFLHASCIGLLILLGEDAGSIYSWIAGSLSGITWDHFRIIAPWSLIGLILPLCLSKSLNIFELGDDIARNLGLNTNLIKLFLTFIIIILTGSSVSISGSIGFLSLISPHIARRIVGHNYTALIPTTAFLGACILIVSDDASRFLFKPQEIPVGVFTALVGCPYFLYLLRKKCV